MKIFSFKGLKFYLFLINFSFTIIKNISLFLFYYHLINMVNNKKYIFLIMHKL